MMPRMNDYAFIMQDTPRNIAAQTAALKDQPLPEAQLRALPEKYQPFVRNILEVTGAANEATFKPVENRPAATVTEISAKRATPQHKSPFNPTLTPGG